MNHFKRCKITWSFLFINIRVRKNYFTNNGPDGLITDINILGKRKLSSYSQLSLSLRKREMHSSVYILPSCSTIRRKVKSPVKFT